MSDTTSTSGVSDADIGHVFDQTNGVVDALDGESGGTAAGDTASAAERDDAVPSESDAATDVAPAAVREEPAERTPDDVGDSGVTDAEEFAVDRSGTATAVAAPSNDTRASDDAGRADDAGPADDAVRSDDSRASDDLGPATEPTPLTADGDDGIGHVFDQTNGVVEGLSGDSDGSAESDVVSAGERANDDPTFDDATVQGADEGVEDLDRRNP